VVDPAKHRDDAKRLAAEQAGNTFEKIAREWYANKVPTWSERTSRNMIQRLEADIFPHIGSRPIGELKHRDIIATLRKIEERGASEIAHRMKAVCTQIFSYAIQCGVADRNLVVDMKDVLKTRRASHSLQSMRTNCRLSLAYSNEMKHGCFNPHASHCVSASDVAGLCSHK
jgi:hypothetical protein